MSLIKTSWTRAWNEKECSTVSSSCSSGPVLQWYVYIVIFIFMKANFESLQALASSSYILSFAGYVNPNDEPGAKDNQPDSVIMALRIMLGAIPAALLGFSYLLVWFYPLTKEKVDEIQIKLTEMRRRK